MRYIFFILTYLFLNYFSIQAQVKMEVSIKPTQLLFKDVEIGIGIKKINTVTGLLLAYRPSSKDSGTVKAGARGAGGAYPIQNFYNPLYTSFLIGIYRKCYFDKKKVTFFEADLFYRNWAFKNKKASYNNDEGYRFDGLRSENVNVFCLKLLIGKTFYFNQFKKFKPFIDLYAGLSGRYKISDYITQQGFVYDTYYTYKEDLFKELLPSFQFGCSLGIKK
jgi:hypothetical protein